MIVSSTLSCGLTWVFAPLVGLPGRCVEHDPETRVHVLRGRRGEVDRPETSSPPSAPMIVNVTVGDSDLGVGRASVGQEGLDGAGRRKGIGLIPLGSCWVRSLMCSEPPNSMWMLNLVAAPA